MALPTKATSQLSPSPKPQVNYAKLHHNYLLFILIVACAILVLINLMLFLTKTQSLPLLPKVALIDPKTPIAQLNLISPQPNSTVSNIATTVVSISTGRKITGGELTVDGNTPKQVGNTDGEKLTIRWDTTKLTNGSHQILIKITDDQNRTYTGSTAYEVSN